MDNVRLDLGLTERVHVESFGEPGSRTFRILAETDSGTVSLWLEKEQVVMLGSAIDEILERMPAHHGTDPTATPSTFRGELEVRVGSLAVGYDPERGGFSVEATDFTSPFELDSIAFLTSRSAFEGASREISEIVASGRPRCPLCGTPLSGEPHFCPPSNGHAHTTRDE